MNIREILKKAGLDEATQAQFEESIKKVIEEKVDVKVTEEKQRLEKLSEEYVKETVEEETAKIKELCEQKVEDYKKEYDEWMTDKLDKFLDNEISESISDEAIERLAINETFKPVVEGIKKVFEEQGLELNTEGEAIVKKLKEEVETLKEQNSTLIDEKTELASTAEKAAIRLRINDATADLTNEQKERVVEFFEGKNFEHVDERIDNYVEHVIEESESAKNGKDKKDDLLDENTDSTIEEPTKEPIEEDTVIDSAGDYWFE